MRTLVFIIGMLMAAPQLLADDGPANKLAVQERDSRMQWWREARFGMFVHWGLYSIPAGEWGDRQWKKGGVCLLYTSPSPRDRG